MGHYDNCRDGYCPKCGQGDVNYCKHYGSKASLTKQKVKTNQELMVFWRYYNGFYDTVLGSPIDKLDDVGNFYVPRYQMWVKPILILPVASGKKLEKKIAEVENEFFNKKDDLIKEYKNKINKLLKE